jgi:ATP-dependent DNA helicase RecG
MSKITAKECQNVEYKRSWKDEYLKWICGFANAQGVGNVVLSRNVEANYVEF